MNPNYEIPFIESQKQIDRLIQRRFLLQLGNENLSLSDRFRVIINNYSGIKSLMLDIVKN